MSGATKNKTERSVLKVDWSDRIDTDNETYMTKRTKRTKWTKRT